MTSGDTIAAISSAAGPAGRMIVRLSGAAAGEIARRSWSTALPSHACAFRGILHLRGMEVSAWLYHFCSPRSYTGENSVEFHIPGNPLLATMLLEELLRGGARAADPGEFTARAYFNGKLDLTEAEGVAATIAANGEQELAAARQLMSGELARRLAPVTDLVAETLALLEVGIDFTDEDVTFLSADDLRERIGRADDSLGKLIDASVRFERLAHEPQIVLVGRPNAGKSTLLNALAGHERAIVSPVAGTTRDVLTAHVPLARGIVRLTDAAGIDEDNDVPASMAGHAARAEIERQMRERSLRAVREADRVLLVHAADDVRPALALKSIAGREPDAFVRSKSDVLEAGDARSAPALNAQGSATASIRVSARTGEGLDALRAELDRLSFGSSTAAPALALNARHANAIDAARAALARAAPLAGGGAEVLALELREALEALGAVTGHVSSDDLLGRIFSAFCIGK